MDILDRGWTELNGRNVKADEDRGEMMFNAFVDTAVEDPADAWKWRGTRSMARNKGIAMHANLTAAFLLPHFTAQNESDEVDRDFSDVMNDIIEWMAEPTNSEYQSSFLAITFAMMQDPVAYLGAEYCEVFQKIRVMAASGDYTTKEILDEVLSGFRAPVLGSTQVLIANAYERNIQKHRYIIKRRYVEKEELAAKWSEHENWEFVQAGEKSVYSADDDMFHAVKDDENPNLVAEDVYLSRRGDKEITFASGVYLGASNVDDNPIKHRDNRDAPKYNITPFGYYRIGKSFFYYKSMMNCLGWDNDYYDAMSEVVMNAAFLESDPPSAISGSDEIDSDINFPGALITLENTDAKVTNLFPPRNMAAGFNALRETEKSMNDGSVNETLGGNLPDAAQKAYNVAQAQTAAKKIVSGVAKSLAASVAAYGDLMKDIALNHLTVAQVEELEGGVMKLKYRSFFLDSKSGSVASKKSIKFDESLIGATMTKKDKEYASLALLEQYPDEKDSVRRVNPELFAKFKYLAMADTEEIFVKNAEYWQPVLLNLKAALANDPYANQKKLTAELLHSYFQGRGEDFVQDAPTPAPGQGGAQGSALGNMVNQKLLAGASAGVA